MQVVILDDEALYRKSVAQKVNHWALNTHHKINIMEYHSSEDLLEAWENGFKVDLMFLDIEIPNELDGIQLARRIVSQDENVQIVYLTNYSNYSLLGYEVNAIRFLLKPVTQENINTCMDIAWNKWILSQNTFIRLQENGRVFVIAADEIMYVESSRHRITLHLCSDKSSMVIAESMNVLEKQLSAHLFVKCYRGMIVNIRYVRMIKADRLYLSDRTEIPVGRTYLKDVRRAFDHYYQGEINFDQYI